MYKEQLLERCVMVYGEIDGSLIHKTMHDISKKDFCVATGLKTPEISISRGCYIQGRIFRLAWDDYSLLVMPDNIAVSIASLTYKDIVKHLPTKKTLSGQLHCFMDNPLNLMFDFESLI